MIDNRMRKLAHSLINYSLELKEGERLLIENFGDDIDLAKCLVEEAYAVGGIPFTEMKNQSLNRTLLMNCNEEQLKMMCSYESSRMKDMDCYIGIRGGSNSFELSDVPAEKNRLYSELYSKPLHSEIRVPHTRWCVMRYPNPAMAQLSCKSTESFEDYYFNVCCLDWKKMSLAMEPLVALVNRTDKVRLIAKDTDISFSLKGMVGIKCDGKMNIPDGEVYTAPVRNSVNGRITYNTPSLYQGNSFENVSFLFENGKIIEATSNNTERLNSILNTDEGARYIGEFAFGLHPYVTEPMKDILFDEKISGSIHFTPGSCYNECSNGNKSAIHWDLVLIMTPEYGGGEIWFDDVLIRKDGLFVIDELKGLNPDNLK